MSSTMVSHMKFFLFGQLQGNVEKFEIETMNYNFFYCLNAALNAFSSSLGEKNEFKRIFDEWRMSKGIESDEQ